MPISSFVFCHLNYYLGMKPAIGANAPELELSVIGGDYPGETQIKLSDLKGERVVLYFYPKNNTPG